MSMHMERIREVSKEREIRVFKRRLREKYPQLSIKILREVYQSVNIRIILYLIIPLLSRIFVIVVDETRLGYYAKSADFKKKPEVEAGVSMLSVYNSLQWK